MEHSSKSRILVVEDESHIAEALKLNLELQGHEVNVAHDGITALEAFKQWRPDLIVLDIMLPGIDGLAVLRSIRLEDENIPVLILSAKGSPEDRVKGFRYGVDDYLVKPFHLDEFLLRVDRLLTRAGGKRRGEMQPSVPLSFDFGDNHIDFVTNTAICRQGEIQLTPQESKLLKLFIANRGKPLSRKTLLKIGWGYTGEMSTRTVDNFMVRLRKYFEKNPKKPEHFKSRRAVGYIFEP